MCRDNELIKLHVKNRGPMEAVGLCPQHPSARHAPNLPWVLYRHRKVRPFDT